MLAALKQFPSAFGPSIASPLASQIGPPPAPRGPRAPRKSKFSTPSKPEPGPPEAENPLNQTGLILTTVPPTTSLALYLVTYILFAPQIRPWISEFFSTSRLSFPPGLTQVMDSAMGRQQTSLFEGLGRWGKRLWVNSTYYAANYAWSCVAIAGIISIFNNRLLLLTVIWGGLLVPINLYLPNPWQVTSFLAFRRPTIVYFVNFVCITLLFRIAFSTFVVAVIVCVIVILLHSTFHTPHVNSTSDTPPPVPPKPSPPPPPPPPKLSKAAEAPNGVSPPMKSGEKMSTTTPPKRQRPKANAKKKESTSEGSGVTEEEKQKRLAALTKVVEAVVVGVWKRLK